MNKKRSIFGLVSAAALALFAQAGPVFAGPVTIDVNQVYTGTTPDGSPPWLVATFNQTGTNTGTLTLTSHLTSPDFLKGLENSRSTSTVGWAFFLNQPLSTLSCKSGTCANSNSGFDAAGFNTGPVGDIFNLGFGWGPHGQFQAGDSAVYDLTFASALSGDPFAANGDGWSSVAHVQGISTGEGSGWIVAGPIHSVPEPANLGLFGLGALLVGLAALLRRQPH